jgi:hypothetical protein
MTRIFFQSLSHGLAEGVWHSVLGWIFWISISAQILILEQRSKIFTQKLRTKFAWICVAHVNLANGSKYCIKKQINEIRSRPRKNRLSETRQVKKMRHVLSMRHSI